MSLFPEDFYNNKKIKFHYLICDAPGINELSGINSKKFQRIMANHMLYHIEDSERKSLLSVVNDMLTDDGKFVASTILIIASGFSFLTYELVTLSSEVNGDIEYAPGRSTATSSSPA